MSNSKTLGIIFMIVCFVYLISQPSLHILMGPKQEISTEPIPAEFATQQILSPIKNVNYAPQLPVESSLCANPKLWGNEHHGGWWICSDKKYESSGKKLIYSYGLGADWSFDSAAVGDGCEVHGFDPSGLLWRQGMHGQAYSGIDYANQYPSKNKHFHNWGLGAANFARYPAGTVPQEWPGLGDPQLSKSNSESWELKSFIQTFVDLNHLTIQSQSESANLITEETIFKVVQEVSVLKVDVEGAEWDAFVALLWHPNMASLLRDDKAQQRGFIKQLLVEWHWDPDSTARNARHQLVMQRVEELGFKPWRVTRHEGSDCCLDVSYVLVQN